MNNFLVPILTSNTFEAPFMNSSFSILSTEDTPNSFKTKFMSKMDNAMQVILFEDENTLNQPVTFDNNHQTTVMHDNNNPQVINQNTQLNNNKPISFSLNIHQSTFERTQNFYIDRLNLTDLIGNITSNNNNTNTNNTNIVMNNNINICIS
jgi:hypothetical protein